MKTRLRNTISSWDGGWKVRGVSGFVGRMGSKGDGERRNCMEGSVG